MSPIRSLFLCHILICGLAVASAPPAWGQDLGRAHNTAQNQKGPSTPDATPGGRFPTGDDGEDAFVARTWTVREGLPLNVVWSLETTADGALWAGTLDGLARFDGHSFTTFSGAGTSGLAGNRVVALHARGESLWVGTQTGVSVVRNGTFSRIEGMGHAENFGESPDGTVWIAGRPGLYRAAGSSSPSSEMRLESIALPEFLPRKMVDDVEPLTSDSVFIAVDGQLLFYGNGRFRRGASHLPHVAAQTTAPVRRVATSPRGQLWVGTENELIAVGASSATRYAHAGGMIMSIRFAPDGAVWITTVENGLLRVSESGVRPVDAGGVLPATTRGLVRDDAGQWWVGTHDQGLIRLRSPLFRYPQTDWARGNGAHAIYAEGRSVWASISGHGLCRYWTPPLSTSKRVPPASGRHASSEKAALRRQCFSPAEGLPGSQVWSFQRDDRGTLWLGTTNHLVRRREGRFETVSTPGGRPFRGTSVLFRDSTSTLWIATDSNGIYRKDGSQWVQVLAQDEIRSRVRALHRDQTGTLWIGTQARGVARRVDGKLRWYDADDGIPYQNVRDIYETGDGTIWISTQGGGVARFEGNRQERASFTSVTPEDGLPHRSIHLIREAPEGTVWMTSNGGIFRMPRRQLEAVADGTQDRVYAQVFTEDDGMRARECNGNVQPIFGRDAQGRLWTATVEGPVVFDPHAPAFSVPASMSVQVTSARVDGVPRSVNALRLNPSNYRMAVDFTAVSLRHADDLFFRYRLDEGPWTPARGRRTAEYTGLSPGLHRFEVQATLNGATWYSLQTPLRVRVEPKLYQTWWFRLLAAFAGVGLVAALYGWRVRRAQRRQEALEALVEDRTQELAAEKRKTEAQAEKLVERDQAKSRFFAHVSHEFRTPLSLILSPLQDALLREEQLDRASMKRMMQNAHRLRKLIDQLLDLAALEEGGMSLTLRNGDIVVFTERVVEAFRTEAEQNQIELSVDASSLGTGVYPEAAGGMPMRFDPENVETMLTNLLANALAFTPEGGTIEVRISRGSMPKTMDEAEETKEDAVCIAVADTGPGIAQGELERVFDRFVTNASRGKGAGLHPEDAESGPDREASLEPNSGQSGSEQSGSGLGLGLALTRALARLHGGTVTVESRPGDGSTFSIWLPFFPPDESINSKTNTARSSGTVPQHDGEDAAGSDVRRPDERQKIVEDGAANSGAFPPVRTADATLLVVEDNAELRAFLADRLGDIWTVREAEDGREAWESMQKDAPDLLLSDVMMPGVDGFELCRQVKSDPDLRIVPVILITARTTDRDTVEGLESGADDYVVKPFDLEELIYRIDNHLAARRHVRSHHQETLHLDALGESVADADAEFVRNVVSVIDRHLDNPDFTTDQLAQAVALSRRQLSRRLKDAIGETPAAFVRTCRTEKAKTLLQDGPETIAEVAYAVGFRSSSHFSQVFKDHVGCTPSAFVQNSEGA